LVEEFHLSHEQIAERVGKSRVSITNTLRLLKLPTSIQQCLAEQQITEGHARALLGLPTPQSQVAALQTILRKDLNVRQTEELVRRLTGQKPAPAPKKHLSPELAAVEERLRDWLGTKVKLNHRRDAGTLVIHYYSEEELDELVNRIIRNSST
jgi:ParB family transcriptional regulator, chromosome partitioning protein